MLFAVAGVAGWAGVVVWGTFTFRPWQQVGGAQCAAAATFSTPAPAFTRTTLYRFALQNFLTAGVTHTPLYTF